MKLLLPIGLLLSVPASRANDLQLDGITHYGCTIEQQSDGPWRTTVWAEHGDKRDWEMLYSVRKIAAKAMKDCETWRAKTEKAIQKWQKGTG